MGSYTDAAGRPEIAIGHLFWKTPKVAETVSLLEKLGIRPIVVKDTFAVLELRGGTHVVVREGAVEGDKIGFDIMVDGIDAAAERYAARGIEVSEIRRGRIHDAFDVITPDGRTLEVNSSHAGDRVV